jgi:CelD/BcsL family acetyltransferase involved in cellulose biosynthesis
MSSLTGTLESRALAVRVEADLATVEALWRSACQSLVGTPYQGFDACAAWARSLGVEGGARLSVVVASTAEGTPRFLLPLAITRRGPLQVAEIMGGKHTNFAVPLFAPDALADVGALADVLTRAAWLADIDLYAFAHAPLAWRGVPNPLAGLPGVPSANVALRGTLDDDGEATLRRIRGGPALRKLRGKEKKLAALGTVTHTRAAGPAEAGPIIETFHAQKALWFKERGIRDVFSPPAARAYVAGLAETGAFEFHALRAGERIVATAVGACHDGRFSMAFNSYDPEFARMSPGDVLLREMVKDLVERGISTMDFGVGDAEYKRHWLDQDEPMRDVAFGVGAVGAAAASAFALGWRVKARIKSDNRFARLARVLKGERTEKTAAKDED